MGGILCGARKDIDKEDGSQLIEETNLIIKIIRCGVSRCLNIFSKDNNLDMSILHFLDVIRDEVDYIIINARIVTINNEFNISNIIPSYNECACNCQDYIRDVRMIMCDSVIECINSFPIKMSVNNSEFFDIISGVVGVVIDGIRMSECEKVSKNFRSDGEEGDEKEKQEKRKSIVKVGCQDNSRK